ncbi:MAG TPA: serine--tRNA ligase [Candidatus Paceibacterota bacterium]
MLDIRFIKENKDIVQAAAKAKNKPVNLDELLRLADERKELKSNIDEINQKRNLAAKEQNREEGGKLKKELEEVELRYTKVDKEFVSLMLKVPNIISPDTPVGQDETGNKVLRQWGEKPQFDFAPKEHFELGEKLGVIDNETATAVSGPRFAYIKGDLVLMQFAVLQHCFEILNDKKTLEEIAKNAGLSINVNTFTPVLPPAIVKTAVQNRMARFLSPEEHYIFPEDNQMLVGSAEHTLGPIYMDKIIEEGKLPIRLVGYSTAFRREAGSYGRDMKGILRLHQFDKLEMETFCLPENSLPEQDFLVAIQEHLLQTLKLPYQVVAICTADMGFPDYRQIDIETWMPGQNKYRETHTADLTTSFQSRRLNTKVKRTDGNVELVHINDATLAAMGRMLIAIMENYQQENGSIEVPKVLRPYMGKRSVIEAK